jgi:hypothetical protein
MTKFMKTISAACLAVGMFSCAETQKIAANIDSEAECKGICNRYATCYDPQFASNACAENCENKAKADGEFRRSADACNECMVGNACTQTTAECGAECRPVVPLPATSTSAR